MRLEKSTLRWLKGLKDLFSIAWITASVFVWTDSGISRLWRSSRARAASFICLHRWHSKWVIDSVRCFQKLQDNIRSLSADIENMKLGKETFSHLLESISSLLSLHLVVDATVENFIRSCRMPELVEVTLYERIDSEQNWNAAPSVGSPGWILVGIVDR